MSERRPDPDLLLERVRAEEVRARRGALKIYLGASPGVGKTYAMLGAAQAKLAEGADAVAGVVETHGRPETERLLAGLEVLPRRAVEYRGTTLREFDLDATMARRPRLVLVDELAHANAPGSRHAKRWQDVSELLQAGIDVYSTLNIQHLESLNDVVAQITGVTVRETVPDSVLDAADEVELVDVTADVLLERLRDGKVYVPEQARHALDRFFRRGNLIALRELALRRTAERVDEQMRGYMVTAGVRETWPVAERLLVCVGGNPAGARLIRAGRRMAASLRAEWIAAYVETRADAQLSAADREAVARNLRLAEDLGARTVRLSGERPSDEILACARAHNVTKIVAGKPTHPRWRDLILGSLLDDLVRGSGKIDVFVITGEAEDERPRGAAVAQPRASLRSYGEAAFVVLAATAVGRALAGVLNVTDIAMLYLLAVVIVSSRNARGPSVAASLLSIALFDFAFVPPHFTFAVSEVKYVLTFGVMLVVALVMGGLTSRIRAQAEAAREREQRTAALYAMSRELASGAEPADLAAAAARHIESTFGCRVTLLLGDASGALKAAPGGSLGPLDEKERAVAQWVYEHGENAGLGTDTLPAAAALYVPLKASGRAVGVVGVAPTDPRRFQDPVQRQLLETLSGLAAVALERAALAERGRQAQVEMEGERLRTALLSSLSHDLRTPLAGIEGAASSLLQDAGALGAGPRRDLAETILGESRRMTRLVGNLLDMVRVESDSLEVHREWQPLEEVVGVALLRADLLLKDHPVTTALPPDLPLVPIDGLLVEQVLMNLLENAARHTPPGTPVDVSAAAANGEVVVTVADRGPGLPPGEEERVFEKFRRLRGVGGGGGGGGGAGLGLTICRGIVRAHGGRIWTENRDGGGAAFRFTIPIVGTPPAVEGDSPESASP